MVDIYRPVIPTLSEDEKISTKFDKKYICHEDNTNSWQNIVYTYI